MNYSTFCEPVDDFDGNPISENVIIFVLGSGEKSFCFTFSDLITVIGRSRDFRAYYNALGAERKTEYSVFKLPYAEIWILKEEIMINLISNNNIMYLYPKFISEIENSADDNIIYSCVPITQELFNRGLREIRNTMNSFLPPRLNDKAVVINKLRNISDNPRIRRAERIDDEQRRREIRERILANAERIEEQSRRGFRPYP